MLYVQTKKDLKAKKSGKGLKKPLSKEMRAFIQGAIFAFCQAHKTRWFCTKDLFGKSKHWTGTPLEGIDPKRLDKMVPYILRDYALGDFEQRKSDKKGRIGKSANKYRLMDKKTKNS